MNGYKQNQEREAKRVRLLNFWAKRRIVQKLFSICMIVWISLFVYQGNKIQPIRQKQIGDNPLYMVTIVGYII